MAEAPITVTNARDSLRRELEQLKHRAWTTTFYSYRGGVGRTTCALNAALGLAIRGKEFRPFFLDFDLEAPGVDEFERFRPDDPEQPGLMEYVRAYLDSKERIPPDLAGYVYEKEGVLVMRSGRKDANYLRDLAQHDWDHFYRFEDGQLFFENLRAAVKQQFGCTHMIVDSRTGLTNIGGVCLGHLADSAVFVFQPTPAHSTGLRIAVEAVQERDREPKRLPRLFVASRVREIRDGELDPDEVKLARDVAFDAESHAMGIRGHVARTFVDAIFDWSEFFRTEEWLKSAQFGEDLWPWFSVDQSGLYFVQSLDRIRERHRPDSFLRQFDYYGNDSTNSEHVHFFFTWIHTASDDVRESMDSTFRSLDWFCRLPELSAKELREAVEDEGVRVLAWAFEKHPFLTKLPATKRATISTALARHGRVSSDELDSRMRYLFRMDMPPPPPAVTRKPSKSDE